MAQLRHHYHEFRQRDTEILCIGPDGPRSFRRYWEKERMPFVGLSDHTHAVSDLYDQEVSLLKLGRMPALFVIDKDGHIRHSHYGSSMADIPGQAELLGTLDRLNEQAAQLA